MESGVDMLAEVLVVRIGVEGVWGMVYGCASMILRGGGLAGWKMTGLGGRKDIGWGSGRCGWATAVTDAPSPHPCF